MASYWANCRRCGAAIQSGTYRANGGLCSRDFQADQARARRAKAGAGRRIRDLAFVALCDPTPGRGACRGCEQLIGNHHLTDCQVYLAKLAQAEPPMAGDLRDFPVDDDPRDAHERALAVERGLGDVDGGDAA